MHTTTNFLFANLAFADLLTLLWCIPGVALQYSRHPDGILGDIFCKFITMNHLAGISLLVAGLRSSKPTRRSRPTTVMVSNYPESGKVPVTVFALKV